MNSETPDVVFEDVNVDILSSDLAATKGNELMEQITSVARQSVKKPSWNPWKLMFWILLMVQKSGKLTR